MIEIYMSIAHKYKFFDMPTCPTSFKQWFQSLMK